MLLNLFLHNIGEMNYTFFLNLVINGKTLTLKIYIRKHKKVINNNDINWSKNNN